LEITELLELAGQSLCWRAYGSTPTQANGQNEQKRAAGNWSRGATDKTTTAKTTTMPEVV